MPSRCSMIYLFVIAYHCRRREEYFRLPRWLSSRQVLSNDINNIAFLRYILAPFSQRAWQMLPWPLMKRDYCRHIILRAELIMTHHSWLSRHSGDLRLIILLISIITYEPINVHRNAPYRYSRFYPRKCFESAILIDLRLMMSSSAIDFAAVAYRFDCWLASFARGTIFFNYNVEFCTDSGWWADASTFRMLPHRRL